ncbi:MAG: hypothetical protein M0T77_13680 [Actinomycetota bacterium]|nr:hypothetical protein [Actinomycetota bacterium]
MRCGALDRAAAERVQHVDEVAAHGDAGGEGSTRANHLPQVQAITGVHAKHRNGVAARVDREQLARVGVVDRRVLRCEVVDDRPPSTPPRPPVA